MKTVLIMVISLDKPPYDEMMRTQINTWDSIHVEGVDTVYYCGMPMKENTDKILYFPVVESLYNMGYKDIEAFEWVLKNKTFDYIARVNSNTYVDKKKLIDHVQSLPGEKYYGGLTVQDVPEWSWAGCGLLISRDVIKTIINNKESWNHKDMEDKAMSMLVKSLKIPWSNLKACSIDGVGHEWLCLSYGHAADSFHFTDFADLAARSSNFFYRCKQDSDRRRDKYVMEQLFKHLP